MSWSRLDDGFHDNGKILSLSHEAFRLYVCSITYASRQNTRGALTKVQAEALARLQNVRPRYIKELVAVGVWEKDEYGVYHVLGYGYLWEICGADNPQRAAWNSVRRSVSPLIYQRDEHRCVYCGATQDLTIDHIIPIDRGGGNEPENLATACRSCNSSKQNKTLEEWRQ